MKQKEKELFKALCSFKSEKFNEKLLDAATPHTLGQLFFNRMNGVAYGVLKNKNLLANVNREFRNSLKAAYEQNIEKNRSFSLCLAYLTAILSECDCKYAMLKGAYLCSRYPAGYRTSNDIDLLVLPENITEVGNVLLNAGFKQGYIRNEEFIPASRKEIIESKMLRGETVPYIKEIGFPKMKYLEVDINFSLDYKNGDTDVIKKMLERASLFEIADKKIWTLDRFDFLIHLCCHLYKEATTLPWVEMKRDMTLYKYCDIYALIEKMPQMDVNVLFNRANQMGLSEVCAFAILQTAQLFEVTNEYAVKAAEQILKDNTDFLHQVVSPKDNRTFVYREKDISERFFAADRKKLLKEVYNEEFEHEK